MIGITAFLQITIAAAGVGYLFDTIGLLFIDTYTTTPDMIAMVIALVEIAFPVWLLVKGVRSTRPTPTNTVIEPDYAGTHATDSKPFVGRR